MTALSLPRPTTEETWVCIKCRRELPSTDFYWNASRNRRTGSCRACKRKEPIGERACAHCKGPIPKGRNGTTCSRACVLALVGLPAGFDAKLDLDRATEEEVRATLNAVMMAAGTHR
jgi:hypothetical protein